MACDPEDFFNQCVSCTDGRDSPNGYICCDSCVHYTTCPEDDNNKGDTWEEDDGSMTGEVETIP